MDFSGDIITQKAVALETVFIALIIVQYIIVVDGRKNELRYVFSVTL